MSIRGVYILTLLLSLPAWAFAASPISPLPETMSMDVETRILADEMVYLASEDKVIFKGKVHVVRPDFELWSDSLSVFLEPTSNAKGMTAGLPKGMGSGDVERIIAEKNVRMKRETSVGLAEKVSYLPKEGLLVMEGEPSLLDGESIIKGHTIKYYTQENRSEVIGAPGRQVHMVFPSKSAKKLPNMSKPSPEMNSDMAHGKIVP